MPGSEGSGSADTRSSITSCVCRGYSAMWFDLKCSMIYTISELLVAKLTDKSCR